MRVLVTGSEGSLMQWVIPHLLRTGHEVIGVDNLSRYGETERDRAYEFINGDLCDRQLTERATSQVDAIIQAAAQIYGVRGFHERPADILARDMELHQNLLWQAVERKLQRFVYISSSMVYERCQQIPSREDDVDDMAIPKTDYGLSKLVGERLCRAFAHQYGLTYTIWRPFNIITPLERSESEPGIAHVFADFIHRIVIDKQNPMTILGDGEQIRCFTWIDEVATAVAEYSFIGETKSQAFNLGNPEPLTMKQLAHKIFAMAQERGLVDPSQRLEFTYQPIYEDDVRLRVPSIEKAESILGWSPKVNVDESLRRCFEAAVA